MKTIAKIFSGIVVIFLISCNSSFYNNVNDMGGQPATLYLKKEIVLKGK